MTRAVVVFFALARVLALPLGRGDDAGVSDRPATPSGDGCAHVLRVHVLLAAATGSTLAAGLLLACLLARAWSLALGAAGLLVVAAAAGALSWTRRPRLRRAAAAALAGALAVGAGLVAPWPRRAAPALVRAVTLTGEEAGAPWFGGIPELHLVRLGAWLDTRGAERAWLERGLFDEVHARLATAGVVDPGRSYVLEAWLADRGHVWLACPDGPGPFPLLVFLHGNGGPFHFYPQVFARAAVERGVAIALPTWGFGDWTTPAGRRRALEAIALAARVLPIDLERVTIGGLSAGGIGAVELFAREPARFVGCVAISGAPTSPSAGDPTFGGRPLLLVHGARDRRVPLAWAESLAEATRARGGRVELVVVEDGDHFIALTHEREVVDHLLDRVARRDDPAPGGAPR